MIYRPLAGSGLEVSALCLGTMTFGEQNSPQESHRLLDLAVDAGINFLDAAEMYPVPPRAETYGHTEEIIGSWPRWKELRSRLVLATKVVGPWGNGYPRDGRPRLNRLHIHQAVDSSLQRLKTDYIDLYQLHWPDRNVQMFEQRGFVHHPKEEMTPLEESLEALVELQKAGKIRHWGVSNETPWGLMSYLKIAENRGWPRPLSIQNAYSLLNRLFEVGLAEIAHRENVPLLAYSPLGFGVLSGKYVEGRSEPRDRVNLYPRFKRYSTTAGVQATAEYVKLARELGQAPAALALSFAMNRTFCASAILGVTRPEQLQENLGALDIAWTPELQSRVDAIQALYPDPCP